MNSQVARAENTRNARQVGKRTLGRLPVFRARGKTGLLEPVEFSPRYAKESRSLFTSHAGDNHRRGREKRILIHTRTCARVRKYR